MLPTLPIPGNARFWNIVALFFLALCTAFFLAGMVRPLLVLPTHVNLEIGEGWIAGHAARFLQGLSLYPPADMPLSNNYPPLFFLVEAVFGKFGADMIFTGRWVALAAFFASGLLVYLIARKLGCSKLAAALGALFLLATHARFFPYYIARNDPQWLAHALMFGGLYMLVSGKTKLHTVLSVALMLAAGLTKHNIIAVPVGAFLWLFCYHRRRFIDALIAATALGMAALVGLHSTFGDAFWQNIFTPRVVSLKRLLRNMDHLPAMVMGFVLWLICTAKEKAARRHENAVLVHFIIFAALLEFFAFAGGHGVSGNITFDLINSLALAMALFFQHFLKDRDSKKRAAALAGLGLLFFIQLAAWPETKFIKYAYDSEAWKNLVVQERQMEKTIAAIRSVNGNVWCQNAGFCYWAGKPLMFETFNTSQRIQRGAYSLEKVQRQFTAQKVKALQIDKRELLTRPPQTMSEVILARFYSRLNRDINPKDAAGAVLMRKTQ